MSGQVPTRKCPAGHDVELPIVLIGETSGQNVIVFAGFCRSCKMVEKRQPVLVAFAIGRQDYLNLRKQGIPIAEGL